MSIMHYYRKYGARTLKIECNATAVVQLMMKKTYKMGDLEISQRCHCYRIYMYGMGGRPNYIAIRF